MEVIVGVEPSLAGSLTPDQEITLHPVYGGEHASEVTGKVHQVGEQINAQTHLRDVSITPPPDSPLLPGAFVIADIPAKTSTGLLVPRDAVTLPDGNPVVFTIADGKAKKHAVTLGLTNGDDVEIQADDLHAGDTVITEGALELDDGSAVKIQETPATQSTTSESPATTESATTAPRPEAP
jgi:multidrug efflux pump subunit AcrA (membrane-fusion protein)